VPGSRRSKAWKKSSARGEDKTTVEEVERIGSALALGRHVENLAAGGGRAVGIAAGCRAESRAAPEEEEKGDFPRDLFVILENCRDLLVKKNLTTVLELKQKCGQNESCTTFQVPQLCFRV
jgi:hypothetical protein